VLVQRIFLRVSPKPVTYPTVGQPFEGRLWCAKSISIETTQTPDLQDPNPGKAGTFLLARELRSLESERRPHLARRAGPRFLAPG
jgi:hypothetical protein